MSTSQPAVATDKDGKPLNVTTKPAQTTEQIKAATDKGHESVSEVRPPSPGSVEPLDKVKVDNALKNLQKVEDELLAYSGKPGVNPHIFINDTILPLRKAIKEGYLPKRADENNETKHNRVALFNEAVGHALQVNFESANIKVPIYIHPAQEGSKLVGSDGTKSVLLPVE